RREDVNRDRVAGTHDKRTIRPPAIREHPVEGGRLVEDAGLARGHDAPDRVAYRIDAGRVLQNEAALGRAVGGTPVGIELQLIKGLTEEALWVGNRSTEPEGRPRGVHPEGAVAREHRRPGHVFR